MANWVIFSASPNPHGKSQAISQHLFEKISARNDSSAQLFCASSYKVGGCIGCDKCKDNGSCIFADDMDMIQRAIDEADAVFVISPIYFAGVPSQFKALLDRFQPYYWKHKALLIQDEPIAPKRPLQLVLIGEGGDPYGAEHARALVASPFALAGFEVVGCETFIRKSEEEIHDFALLNIEEVMNS